MKINKKTFKEEKGNKVKNEEVIDVEEGSFESDMIKKGIPYVIENDKVVIPDEDLIKGDVEKMNDTQLRKVISILIKKVFPQEIE